MSRSLVLLACLMKKLILFILISFQLNAAWGKIVHLAGESRHSFANNDPGSPLGYYDVTVLPDGRIMLSFGFRDQTVRDEIFYRLFPSGYPTPTGYTTPLAQITYFGGQVVLARVDAARWFQQYRASTTPPVGLLPMVRLTTPRVV